MAFISGSGSSIVRILSVAILFALSAGCYSCGLDQSGSSGGSRDRSDNAISNSYRSTEHDHGSGWQAERDAEGNSYGSSQDGH